MRTYFEKRARQLELGRLEAALLSLLHPPPHLVKDERCGARDDALRLLGGRRECVRVGRVHIHG